MSRLSRSVFLFLMLFCSMVEPVSASNVIRRDIRGPIEEAISRMRVRHGSRIGDQDIGGATQPESVEVESGLGAWSFGIVSFWSTNEARHGFLTRITRPTYIENHGTHLEYIYSSDSINIFLVDQVTEAIAEGIADVENAHPSLDTTVWFDTNRYWVRSVYDYSQGIGWDEVVEPLEEVMKRCQQLTTMVYVADWKQGEKFRKEIEKRKFDSIGLDEFCALVNRNFTRADVVNGAESELGEWWFVEEGFSKQIINRGTTMELGVAKGTPETWSEQERAEFLAFAEGKVKKPGRAESLIVRWHPEQTSILQALAVYDIAGSKGKDIFKDYESSDDFIEKVSEELIKKQEDMHKARLDGAVETLDANEFMSLVDDGLESLELREGYPNGHWNFMYDGHDFDLFNHGDHMVFGFSYSFPDNMSSDEREAVVVEARKIVEKKRPKGMDSMTADYYLGNTDYLFLNARLAYGRKAEDINKAYHYFLYEYPEKVEKKVRKLLDD